MVASFALRVSALNGDTEAVTRQLARGRRRGYPGRWIDDVSLRGVNLQKQRELSRELCDGQCPALFLAAYNGHDAIVRLLLHEGADANLPNSSGQTALFAACTGGHEVSVKELLNADAQKNHGKDSHGGRCQCVPYVGVKHEAATSSNQRGRGS